MNARPTDLEERQYNGDECIHARVCIAHAWDDVEAVVALFEAIASEEGWQPEGQLRAYLDRSVYFTLHVEGGLAGGLQLVLPGTEGSLPSQRVWPEVQPGSHAAHVAVLALRKEFRGRPGLFWLLCQEMWRYCVREGIEELWLEATPPTLRCYRRLGFPLEIVGGLREHWGEDCCLCRMGVREVAESLIGKAERAETYRQVVARACRDLALPAALTALPK